MTAKKPKSKEVLRRLSISVRRPKPASPPPFTQAHKTVQSEAVRMAKDDKMMTRRFENYLAYAPKIVLPVTLRKLRKPLTKQGLSKLDVEADRLLEPSHPARCTSAQYVDRNGVPLLYYFERRLNIRLSAKHQYEHQSVEEVEKMLTLDKSATLTHDGLGDIKCLNYQLAVQALCVDTKLHKLFDEARHLGKNEMDFVPPDLAPCLDHPPSVDDAVATSDITLHSPSGADPAPSSNMSMSGDDCSDSSSSLDRDTVDPLEEEDDAECKDSDWEDESMAGNDLDYVDEDDDETNMGAYDTDNLDNNGLSKTEQAGVVHLVHGWTQRGHPNKLYISGDVTSGSTTVAAAASYYSLSEAVARTVALAFKAVFPEWYSLYEEAFEAGVWFMDDPGPFLGHAVVYKLQGRLHRDRHDCGPSVSFPVGQFTGGEMIFPQLNVKLQYSPGDFCIFFSSDIYHMVSPFVPLPQTLDQAAHDITPGRVGSVFFFPKNSLRILKGKPRRWGYKTAFGMNEHLHFRQRK